LPHTAQQRRRQGSPGVPGAPVMSDMQRLTVSPVGLRLA